MAFLGLYKRETEDDELSWPARNVVEAVRNGSTPQQAAARANVPPEELRRWMREPAFRAALRRKHGEPRFWQ